jgi:hypothetical protein
LAGFPFPSGEWHWKWWDEHWKTIGIVALCVAAIALTVISFGTTAPLTALVLAMTVGAISGAAVNTAVYLATTPASQRSLGGILGAAVSGAMTGAAIGASMVPGVGWGAAAAIGAVGGAAGYAAGNAIAGKSITLEGLVAAGIVGAFAAVGGKWLSSTLRSYYGLQDLYRMAGRPYKFAPLPPTIRNLDWVAFDFEAGWAGREVAGALIWAGYSALSNLVGTFARNAKGPTIPGVSPRVFTE